MEIKRLFDYIDHLQQDIPAKSDLFARSIRGQWVTYSTEEFVNYSYSVARGLLALGYGKGTKVIDICNNRPEWNFIDMGTALSGMIHVPVYTTLSHDDYLYIFNNSDAEIIFIGNLSLYKKIAPIAEEMERPAKVILIDESDEIFCFRDMCGEGEKEKEKWNEIIERNKKEADENECTSIVYTSGTTGRPKGVMLSHRNLIFDAHSHAVRHIYNHTHKALSFLPLCHAYERTMLYDQMELGMSIYYAEGLGTIAADLASSHADGFCAVPRVMEMMYDKLEAVGKNLKGIARWIYGRAWKFANQYDNYNNGLIYQLRLNLFDKLVYKKWRDNLGGHEMVIVSGGSSIQPKIVKCFCAAKLRIYEGYGMTESSPVIAVNSPAEGINHIGTVGRPIDGTECVIAEDGEILTRGPHVMLGYYKAPDLTAEIIDENGFLHTGDIGKFLDNGCLKITDRKKEMFKLNNGKYIAPQAIETMLKETGYIDNCIVFGENRKFPSAIIIPNFNKLRDIAKELKIEGLKSHEDYLANEAIIARLHSEVAKANLRLAAHEQIKKEQYVDDEWTSANGMLGQTMKLKRANIHKKYSALMEKIYE